MTKNKGYTLIEVIIVLAIMGILSGLSFITIGIIREANRQSSTTKLDNQISNCLVQTKAISPSMNEVNPLGMIIKKRSDGAYAVLIGFMKGSDVLDSSNNLLDPEKDEDCAAILSKEIANIVYIPSDSSQQMTSSDMVIKFIKADGSTEYGGGAYELYKKNGDLYATIYLDKVSGNHYIK